MSHHRPNATRPQHPRWIYLIVGFGVFCSATAVILIKISTIDPLWLSAYRTTLAALFLLPLFLRQWRQIGAAFPFRQFRHCIWPALFLALHFITWNIGARTTTAASASLIVNTAPLALPFLLYALCRERVRRHEILGTLVAFTGILLLAIGDLLAHPGLAIGNIICLFSMLAVATYVALGRRNRIFPGIWLYVVPIYALAGLFSAIAALLLGSPLQALDLREGSILLALTLIPTIAGHSILNYSLKHLRGQVVSICNLGQFLFATLMAWWLLQESPGPLIAVAALLVLTGALTAIRPWSRSLSG